MLNLKSNPEIGGSKILHKLKNWDQKVLLQVKDGPTSKTSIVSAEFEFLTGKLHKT